MTVALSTSQGALAAIWCVAACGADPRPAHPSLPGLAHAHRDASVDAPLDSGAGRAGVEDASTPAPPITRDPNCVFREGVTGDVEGLEAAAGRLFVRTSDGALVGIEPTSRSCEVVRTSGVADARSIDGVLHYLVTADDGVASLFVVENGRSRRRSQVQLTLDADVVLSELDGLPLILEPKRLLVERAGVWEVTALKHRVVGYRRESPIVLGAGGFVYAGFELQFVGMMFVISPGTGRVTSRSWPNAVRGLARAPGDGCVFVAGADFDLGGSGALRVLCGAKEGPTTEFLRDEKPPKGWPRGTFPVRWVGNRGDDTLVVAGGVRRLSSPKAAPVAFSEPVCMCGYPIARSSEGVFWLDPGVHSGPRSFWAVDSSPRVPGPGPSRGGSTSVTTRPP